jgi:hypothetical protein
MVENNERGRRIAICACEEAGAEPIEIRAPASSASFRSFPCFRLLDAS